MENDLTETEKQQMIDATPDDISGAEVEMMLEEWSQIQTTTELLMKSGRGVLDTPRVEHIGYNNEEVEARGSARMLADDIRDEGYEVDLEYIEQKENWQGRERHLFKLTVTDE